QRVPRGARRWLPVRVLRRLGPVGGRVDRPGDLPGDLDARRRRGGPRRRVVAGAVSWEAEPNPARSPRAPMPRDPKGQLVERELLTLPVWDQFDASTAESVARAVERCLPEPWSFARVEWHECGGQRRHVAL